jgi:hypothetical protein
VPVGGRGVGGDAGNHQQAAPGGVVVDPARLCVATGRTLAMPPAFSAGNSKKVPPALNRSRSVQTSRSCADEAVRRGAVERGAAAREAPAFALLVSVNHRRGIEADGVGGRREVGVSPFRGAGVVAAVEPHVGTHLVEGVADGDAEGFLFGAAGVEESTGAGDADAVREAGEAGASALVRPVVGCGRRKTRWRGPGRARRGCVIQAARSWRRRRSTCSPWRGRSRRRSSVHWLLPARSTSRVNVTGSGASCVRCRRRSS